MSRRAPSSRRAAAPKPAARPNRAVLAGGGVLLLLVIVLIARGCGSDNLSADELRTQASAICTRANAATDRVAVPNAPAGGERFLAEGLAVMRPALTRLQRLKPPDDLRRQYELAVSANARQLQLVGDAIVAVRSGSDPIDAYRLLQRRLTLVSTTANATWESLGIPACVGR